jgi:hypothetical protein
MLEISIYLASLDPPGFPAESSIFHLSSWATGIVQATGREATYLSFAVGYREV